MNFARKPFENERLPRLVFLTAAAAVLVVTAVHGFFLARYLVREQEALDIQVEELETGLEDTTRQVSEAREALARAERSTGDERTVFLTTLYRRKGFSWTGLFNELERITPADVRIRSVAPFEADGRMAVTLDVVGRTLANVLQMVTALETSTYFAMVFPLDEVDLSEMGGGDSGIAATLQLHYVEPEAALDEPPEVEDGGEETPPDDPEAAEGAELPDEEALEEPAETEAQTTREDVP